MKCFNSSFKLEWSFEVAVTYQAHHKYSQCQSEIKNKDITFEDIPKHKKARATPPIFQCYYYIVLLSQTKGSLHSVFLGGEIENTLHWKIMDFE